MPSKIKQHRPKGKQSRKEKNAEYDAKRRAEVEYRAWYGTRKWRRLAAHIKALNPWCVRCDAKGIATPTTTANHIRPHKGDAELFWDEQNIEGVCTSCHSADIQREEHAAGYHNKAKD